MITDLERKRMGTRCFGVSSCRALQLFRELLHLEGTCNCTPPTEDCHELGQEKGYWVLQEPGSMEGKRQLDNPSSQKESTLSPLSCTFYALFLHCTFIV